KLTHLGHDRDAAAVKRSLATLGRTRYGPYLPLGTAVPRRAPTLHAGRAPSLPATRGGVAGRDLLCRHADLLASSESRNDEGRHRRPVLLVLLGRRSRARRVAGGRAYRSGDRDAHGDRQRPARELHARAAPATRAARRAARRRDP